MSSKRLIAAIELPGLVPGVPPTKKPEFTWISPCDLLVDESYQRGVGDKGTRLIRRIVETFDWRKFKPPSCVWTDAGLEVIDGQHSAIAAASHPDITLIPVIVVEAEMVADRAGAFLGMNRDRLGITTMQLHAAALVAGDDNAAAIERVCAACNVTVLRMPPSRGEYRPRDTVAVRALADLIKRVGEPIARHVLGVLADADLCPITASALRAAEAILVDSEYADQVETAELTRAILALGDEAYREASVFAATHGVPKWRGLIAVWFKKTKKRKLRPDPIDSHSQNSEENHPQASDLSTEKPCDSTGEHRPVRRVLSSGVRTSGTSPLMIARRLSMGEPLPGRSALDQRIAGGS